jgi:hypothetical protein
MAARRAAWLTVGVLALAGALRLHRLADQNIWFDEGWTAWLARMDLAAIVQRAAADTHPPLSYWLLHGWGLAAGQSAFAGRLLSVFGGVLTVALLARVGRHVGGARLGLLAALSLALARFHIAWSQELRDYTLAGLLGLAMVWFTLRLFAEGREARGRLWAGYVLATLAGAYTHHLVFLIVLANNVLAAACLARRWRRTGWPGRALAQWALAQLAVLALFAPWLALHLSRAITRTALPLPGFADYLQLAGATFTLGVTQNLEAYAGPAAALLLLAGGGAAWALWGRPGARGLATRAGRAAALCLLLVALPTVVIYWLARASSAIFIPQVEARYLLLFLPGFALPLALGLEALWRWRRWAGAAALLIAAGLQAGVLPEYYRHRQLRDDYHSLATVINDLARPGDGVLLHTDQEWPVLLFYLRQPLPWEGVLAGEPVSPEYAAGLAEDVSRRFERVWLVTIPDALAKDPARLVAAELERRLPVQYRQTFDDKELTLLGRTPEPALSVPAENFAPTHRRRAELADGLTLLGYELPLSEARAGDTLRLVTYWEARAPTTLTLILRGPAGAEAARVQVSIAAGERVRVPSDLRLTPGAAGRYTVAAATGEREHVLARVTVRAVTLPSAGDIPSPAGHVLGGLVRLAGYDLARDGIAAGGQLRLTLFWTALEAVPQDYKVFVQLVGQEFNPDTNNPLWGQVDRQPLDGALPMTVWPVGAVIADGYLVPIDPDAPAGVYEVVVGLYDGLTGERLPVAAPDGSESDHIVLARVELRPGE